MTFDDLVTGDSVFLDANTLIYHFSGHPRYGPACTRLVKRVEIGELQGFVSSHVLADVAHRCMTIEAMNRLNWPATGIAARLRKHHAEIPTLVLFKQAVAGVGQLGIQVLPVFEQTVVEATDLSQAHELLTGDGLIVAVMKQHALSRLATLDTDFDRVPWIKRFTPV